MQTDTRFRDWLQSAKERGEMMLQFAPPVTRPQKHYRLLRAVPKWYEPRNVSAGAVKKQFIARRGSFRPRHSYGG
jgi:hypothetical protein